MSKIIVFLLVFLHMYDVTLLGFQFIHILQFFFFV